MAGSRTKAHPSARDDARREEHQPSETPVTRPLRGALTPATIAGLQRSTGNAAVARLLGGHAPQPTVQRKKREQAGLVFHPKSTLSAARIVAMLKRNKNVPDFIKKSLAVRKGAIVLVGKMPTKPAGTFSEFLEPYLAAMTSPDWQFTTATSTIDVTGQPGSPTYQQIVRPDLAKGQRLGHDIASGPGQTTFFATTLHSAKSEVIYGWTIDPADTGTLGAGRGLIVVVTKITVVGQNGQRKVFTPTEDSVTEAVLHEISAHAGRMTQGEPDAHGNRGVEDIAKEIGEFFRYSTAERGAVASSTSKEIFDFIDRTATVPAP